jgi:hypothetical protein
VHRERSDGDIEKIANTLSDSAELTLKLPALWLHVILEIVHTIRPKFQIKLVSELELPVAEAVCDCDQSKLIIRRNVYRAALQGFGRERMTLAHELGHLILGHTGYRYRRLDELIRSQQQMEWEGYRSHGPSEIISPQEKQEEWEAKRFAVHLLMPRHLAAACRSAREIEKKCLVSQEAAEYRFEELSKLNRLATGTPRPLPPKVLDYLGRQRDEAEPRINSVARTFPITPIFGPNIYPVQRGTVFVIMPLNNAADRRYQEIIKPAVEIDSKMIVRRGDDVYNVGDIRADIWKSICECEVVIADVTGFNPNVIYELGIAHTVGRETIILHEQSSEDEKFPIDFAAYRRINYTNDAPGGQELRRKLATMIKSIR